MKLSCIIIEDEPLAMERTRGYAERLPDLNLLVCFDNAKDALLFLKSTAVDLIFLDINLGVLSGIELLEENQVASQVILTTAYPQYALKGYELNVTDYLLKPYTFDRFAQAVEKAMQRIPAKESADKKFIFIKTEHRLEKLLLSELLYIEGMRDYRRIHLLNKRIMTLQTFRELEGELPQNLVCRVHKSYMVALDKIDSVQGEGIRVRDKLIPISETYRQRFFELIGRG